MDKLHVLTHPVELSILNVYLDVEKGNYSLEEEFGY